MLFPIWIFAFAAIAVLPVAVPAFGAPVTVVATTSILQDLARNVGGPDADVMTLVPRDGDAHVYEPAPSDVRTIAVAGLLIENGLGLEPWLTRLLAASSYAGRLIVATQGIQPLTFENDGRKNDDPHAWQDAANARIYVRNIDQALEAIDPAHAVAYHTRAAAYDRQLADLDRHIRAAIAAVPPGKRHIITTHDAFQYYGKAYGLTFIAPIGVSTEEGEPSAADLGRLEQQIEATGTKALFLENMTDGRLLDQIARDTNATVGPALYSDALSQLDGPAATYIDMMTYNTGKLVEGMRINARQRAK